MIFSTQSQLNCLLIFLFCGFICGIILSVLNIIFLKNYQKKLIKTLFDSVFCVFFCIFFIILLNFFNFGKFSIVLFLSFYLGKFWIQTLNKNLVVIFENSWYNKIKNIANQISSRFRKRNTKDKNEISNKS